MRILFITQYCYPEPDFKQLYFAKELSKKGHVIEILTGYPNYPTGKVHAGYKNNWVKTEIIDGIKITRVPLYAYHGSSKVKRVINYFSFAVSSIFFGFFKVSRPDIIYAYHSPATIAIPAIFYKLIFRRKILYDINDFWPDTLLSTGMVKNKLILKLVSIYCRLTYKFFDQINVVSVGYKKRLMEEGVEEKKISLIYNWPPPIKYDKESTYYEYIENFKNNFTILYAGNVGKAQNMQTLIEVAKEIQLNSSDLKIRFILIGSGNEKPFISKLVNENNLTNVILIDLVPINEIGSFLEKADCLFLHLKKDKLFEITIPSKLFAYMSMGKPILSGVDGETNEIVYRSNSGFIFNSCDHVDLLNAIKKIRSLNTEKLNELGENGKSYFINNFSFIKGVDSFDKLFNKMINN
jgi:glycosyltransferase involved in cell wall biosynthesis